MTKENEMTSTYTREQVQAWRDDIANAAADMVKRAGNEEWKWLEDAIRNLAAAPSQAEPSLPPALVTEIRKLTEWKYCMSYNDSYFGEPEGLVKRVAYELERMISK